MIQKRKPKNLFQLDNRCILLLLTLVVSSIISDMAPFVLGIIFIVSQNQVILEISECLKVLMLGAKFFLDPRGDCYEGRNSCCE